MSKYATLDTVSLQRELDRVKQQYEELRAQNLSLDMSRGKPAPEQLNLSNALFDMVSKEKGYCAGNGLDCRNYGGLDGLPELKKLFGEILGVDPSLVIVGGCSSLNMMYDVMAQGMYKGFGGEKPWLLQGKVKFLCPVPGYDRHFAICEYLGIEMISVPMDENGPVMSEVERLVRDPMVKGMWCVPKFSNPGGVVYSDDVVTALAKMETAAKDFKIMWDNAYAVHLLGDEDCPLMNLYDACVAAGNPDRVIQFTSTSKITFAGAGVSALSASAKMISEIKGRLTFQTIGPDKTNHLRHARLLPDLAAVKAQMKRHAEILAPKFKVVIDGLKEGLGDSDIARWNEPKGGYFISLYVMDGCAKRVVELCKQAGLVLTAAGAAYPYGVDPQDSNIRIAPSYPSLEELRQATKLLCTCVKYAALEKLTDKQ